MINFTVGPVQSCDAVRRIGGENCPYFRTPEFSAVMLECERLMLKFAGAPEGARAVFLTTSGTGGMEATVMNVLTPKDRVLVVNGGSFGHRFCELCEVHGVPHDEIKLNVGEQVKENDFWLRLIGLIEEDIKKCGDGVMLPSVFQKKILAEHLKKVVVLNA